MVSHKNLRKTWYSPRKSSSFGKPHKKVFSLNSLPEDLLLEISSCIASSSLSAVRNLRLVSESFRQICDERYVLCRLSLEEIPLFPWLHNPESFANFFTRCRINGNPEALYRKGLTNYFLDNHKVEGLRFLAEAAESGNQEAKYVYGLVLICLGGETKQNGFKILSSLIKPLMSNTMKELVKLRYKVRDSLWWRGRTTMKQLKNTYVREKCECDGETKSFLIRNCVWHGYGVDNDMHTSSSACELCLWDHEVKLLFDNI